MDQTLHTSSQRILLWAAFVAYLLVLGFAAAYHEPWVDEIHSWNLSKASSSYSDLLYNTRFEGHPPAWYSVMWVVSKFTHDFSYVQLVHAAIASLTVVLILFFSPMPTFVRVLLPFGYFFMYEYAALSRNYAVAVLAAFCICLIMRKNFRGKWPLYYLLLLVMSNTHLLAMIFAGCLHLYNLLFIVEQKGKIRPAAVHVLLGAIIFLPAIYFISPPSDSSMNVKGWVNNWRQNVKTSGQVPLRSMMPVPAWWSHHSWNTQMLLNTVSKNTILNLFFSVFLLAASVFILRPNRKSLVLFGVNFLLSMLIAIAVFPLTSARYSGLVYIGFIAAFWLYSYESSLTRIKKWLMSLLLALQLSGAIISIAKDLRYPFSNSYRVNEFINKVPAGENLVMDYWTVNAVSAFSERRLWCVDMQEEVSIVLWGPELDAMVERKYRYTEGVSFYFQQKGVNCLHMISFGSPATIRNVDPQLEKQFNMELVEQIGGAIDKGGNLYLYKISSQ